MILLITSVFAFIAIVSLIFFVTQLLERKTQQARLKKLDALNTIESAATNKAPIFGQLQTIIDPLSKITSPNEEWERSHIHLKFLHAGWRSENVPNTFFAIKTLLTLALPLIVFALSDDTLPREQLLFFLAISAVIGLYLPNLVLNNAISSRQQDLSHTFPDALDLLVITMEAGLSFDIGLSRVAQEIRIKSQTLSDELNIVLIEMRSGFSRERALRNLMVRTGVEGIDALATLVIQSERFGTSIVDALRIQSEQFRHKRKVSAEEQAAKIGVKLIIPLILFIMPALFIVLLGPAFLQLTEKFLNN